MKAESTVRKMCNALYDEAQRCDGARYREAWVAATALQWVYQETDWTPLSSLEPERAAAREGEGGGDGT